VLASGGRQRGSFPFPTCRLQVIGKMTFFSSPFRILVPMSWYMHVWTYSLESGVSSSCVAYVGHLSADLALERGFFLCGKNIYSVFGYPYNHIQTHGVF
jgi:hypothetical protein